MLSYGVFQRYFTEEKPDQLSKVEDQVDELKGIMVKNIGKGLPYQDLIL